MTTRHIKLNPRTLRPADDNPQRMTPQMFAALKLALRNDTDTIDEPAVWLDHRDSTMRIISGHHRVRAAIELGWKRLSVKVFDDPKLDEAWYRKRLLSVNKTHGDPDDEAVRAFLASTDAQVKVEFPEFDIQAHMLDTGYTPEEIAAYLAAAPGPATHGNLAERFLVPPFSILDTRQGYWREQKQQWLVEIGDMGESRQGTLAKVSEGQTNLINGINSGVSLLDPVLAAAMVHWFGLPKASCFDPFAGDTVFGYVAKRLGQNFTGIELRKEQADLNQRRCDALTGPGTAQYVCDTSANIDNYLDDGSQDFLFSCPPYYDLEVYSDSPEDLSAQGTYAEFHDLINSIMAKAVAKLKPNRFAVIVIGEVRDPAGAYRGLVPDMIDCMEDAGMTYYNDIVLVNSVGTAHMRATKYMANRKVAKVHQNVLVFFKGDLGAIRGAYPAIDLTPALTAAAEMVDGNLPDEGLNPDLA